VSIPSVRIRSLSALLLAVALFVTAQVAPATARPAPERSVRTECSADFHLDDPRFGPKTLPNGGLVGLELINYRRTGRLSPQQLLDKYWDPVTAWWIYPPKDGYLLDRNGDPIIIPTTLRAGQLIDRYGSEYGQFLAPIGSSYSSRSIPPQSLVSTPAAHCNYRAFKVLKPFTVDSGPIAPWFEQQGYGWQYVLKSEHVPGAPSPLTIKWLMDNGYLKRVVGPPSALSARNQLPEDRALVR
jgi:Tuberculosis necrotizing toxin